MGACVAAGLQRSAEAGLAALYGVVLQPNRTVRNAILQALVRRFDAAASLHSKDAAEVDIRWPSIVQLWSISVSPCAR